MRIRKSATRREITCKYMTIQLERVTRRPGFPRDVILLAERVVVPSDIDHQVDSLL